MDPDPTKSRSRRAFSSFLRALTTYLSPLTLVVGPGLALFGIGIAEQWTRWIVFALLVPVAGISWLINEYRIARHKIINEGKVQSPEWLWTFLTNRIPHSRQQISPGAQVMVLVPPGKETEAANLSKIYNHTSTGTLCEGQHNLLFHYVPALGTPGKESPGEAERLEDLVSDLGKCAAVVLLDDGVWKRKYASTWQVIQDWSLENTERAVVSLHLNGTGHLPFNWCLFEAVTSDNSQALHSRLLAQATTRGFQWFHQAQIYRWLVMRLALITLIVSFAAILTSYFLWTWGAKHRQQARRNEDALYNLVTVAGNGSEQVNIAKTLASFRNTQKPDWDTRQSLLNAMAYQIKAIVERNSGVSEVSVSIFSVVVVNKSWLIVDEVGASRPGFTKSPYDFNTDLMSHDQKSIVDCAIVQGAFVLWSGDSLAGTTEDIRAWDLRGAEVGKFDKSSTKLVTEQHKCFYQLPSNPTPPQIASQPGEKDVPHKRLLCAPAGSTFNIHEPGNGAICISVPHNGGFLSESWVRFTLLRFGNALSFSNWARPPDTNPRKTARR